MNAHSEREIIRTLARGPRGPRGAPPIPKWTNDYFLSFTDSEGTPIGPPPQNLIGAQGPVGGSQVFVSRTQAMASSISVAFAAIRVMRFSGDSPLAPAWYRPGTSDGPLAFQDQNDNWWELAESWPSVLMYGAKGGDTSYDTDAIQAAFDDGEHFEGIVFPGLTFKVKCGLEAGSVKAIHFEGTTFLVDDNGPDTTLRDGLSKGKVGLYFNACEDLHISGSASFIGQGTVGATRLAGLVFEKCHRLRDTSIMYLENMAAGRFDMWSDYAVFGDIIAKQMKGFQTFDSPSATAGSSEVVVGCQHTKFGAILAKDNYKPVRYLSVAYDENGDAYDNLDCDFGWVSGTAHEDSIESSLTSIRSGVDCRFAGGAGEGFSLGFYFVRYSGDGAWKVDQCHVDAIAGSFVQTSASVDAALQTYNQSTSVPVGTVYVGSINATCNGEYGVMLGAGRIFIGSVVINGGGRGICFIDCVARIQSLTVRNQNQQAVAIGDGADVGVDEVDIQSGPAIATTAAVTCSNTFGGSGGKGNVRIGKITYGSGGTALDYSYVFLDSANSFESTQIGQINGTGSIAQARFVSTNFTVRRGEYYAATAPTGGTYQRGTRVANLQPNAGEPPGWVCVATGTPGTWKAEANLAA